MKINLYNYIPIYRYIQDTIYHCSHKLKNGIILLITKVRLRKGDENENYRD